MKEPEYRVEFVNEITGDPVCYLFDCYKPAITSFLRLENKGWGATLTDKRGDVIRLCLSDRRRLLNEKLITLLEEWEEESDRALRHGCDIPAEIMVPVELLRSLRLLEEES